MPRQPRIEYEGAIYHIMARGDRREPIVFSDGDRELFVETLGEVCGQTGWEVFAWVLMENHYHLALRTPEPNLVAGMTWFQNTFTRRINTRNSLWGHLFGGRYKSIVVENESAGRGGRDSFYLRTLIDYLHLNPARGGLVDGQEVSIQAYPWSSIARGYVLPPTKRPDWMAVKEGLDLFGEPDTAAGRRRLIKRLDDWAAAERRETAGLVEKEDQSLQSTLRRGWYWGSETFRERLIETYGASAGESQDRGVKSSGLARGHREKATEAILAEAERHFGANWKEARRGDWTRVAVAEVLARKTTLSMGEIARHTNLRSAANASQRIRMYRGIGEKKLARKFVEWKKKI